MPVLLLAATAAVGCQANPAPSSGGKPSTAGKPSPTGPATAGRVSLPRPTGPYKVGTKSLRLVDHGRRDPWTPSRAREPMVSVWNPASASPGKGYVPQMTAKAAAHFGSAQGAAASNLGMPPGKVDWGATPSSPAGITALLKKAMTARVADARFVLDRLPGLGRGRFGGALDAGRVGMAGQSAGGFTAAQTMHDDRRVRAGINMDGQMDYTGGKPDGSELSTVARDGLDRPLLLMGTASEGSGDHTEQPSWGAFWRNTRGWKGDVTLTGSRHATYTDAEALLPQLADRGIVPNGGLAGAVGTVRTERAIAAERAYVASFFDRWLRGRDDHLLDGPSFRFPEMRFTA